MNMRHIQRWLEAAALHMNPQLLFPSFGNLSLPLIKEEETSALQSRIQACHGFNLLQLASLSAAADNRIASVV